MNERLIALERNGAVKLYTVNGNGPREVGYLEVGQLSDEAAALIAAALSDLRSAANNEQPPPARNASERVVPTQALSTARPRHLTSKNQRAEAQIMGALNRHPEGLSLADLAEICDIARPRLKYLVVDLVRRDLVHGEGFTTRRRYHAS